MKKESVYVIYYLKSEPQIFVASSFSDVFPYITDLDVVKIDVIPYQVKIIPHAS